MRYVKIMLIICAAALSVLCGCDDKATDSTTGNSSWQTVVLCTDDVGDDAYWLVFDTDADTLIDSIPNPFSGYIAAGPVFSADGNEAYISTISAPSGYNRLVTSHWPPGGAAAYAYLDIPFAGGDRLSMSPDDDCLKAFRCLVTLPTAASYIPIDEFTLPDGSAFIGGRSRYCYFDYWDDFLTCIDYPGGAVSQIPLADTLGRSLHLHAICPSRSGDSLIATCQADGDQSVHMVIFSTDDFQIIGYLDHENWVMVNDPVMHPGGHAIYWAIPFKSTGNDNIAFSYDILEQRSRVLLTDADIGRVLTYAEISLSPDGRYLYITGAETDTNDGPRHLYRMNIVTREISELRQISEDMNFRTISFRRVE